MRIRSAVLAILVACGDGTAPGRPGNAVLQRMRWEALGIRDYEMAVLQTNEWSQPTTYRYFIRNGSVVRILNAAGDSVGPSAQRRGITMDTLFARAVSLQASDEEGLQLELLFHPTLHFVKLIGADRVQLADDSWSYRVESLTSR